MIKNSSKNTVIAFDSSYKNSFGKIKGLLFAENPKAIVFKTRFGIHTFFMRLPIDLLVLNKQKMVVVLKESIKPNQIVLWNPKFNFVIELPKGSIDKSKTEIGDQIQIDL